MKARAMIEADVGSDGATRFPTLRSESPLLLRKTPDAVFLVGGAAGPLGGDHTELDIVIRSGASVVLRSAAASMALPGDGPSVGNITVSVEDGASLAVDLEPLVSVFGSDHLQQVRIELAGSATLLWRERFVLGRTNEFPGVLRTSFRIERDGRPLIHQDVRLDAVQSPAVLDTAVAIVSDVVIGPPAQEAAVFWDDSARANRAVLADDVAVTTVLADSLIDAEAAVTRLLPEVNAH